ncbi:DUF5753 domain-containing protein [Kitasatospora sp. NPDC057015]|uniref:DUF5753 domain-containing protein n=1 Tax=Kitasatospora sp. NPDC057015 TaxID=3346001 RepID=UPI00363007AF
MEAATRKPQKDLSRRFDEVLNTGGHFARLFPIATSPRIAGFFTAAKELQTLARTIGEYSPTLVPGLLQTPGYARAVFAAARRFSSAEEIETWVVARMARAEIFARPQALKYWAVIDEAVLRRPVGGAAAMREQLAHLAGMIRSRKAVVQVLPFSAGAHALLEGSVCLMTFEDAPPTVYLEGPHVGQLLDDPQMVGDVMLSYDLVRADALSQEASLTLIESAAEEYAHEQG